MALPDNLISQLVKITNENSKRGIETGDNVVYGKVVSNSGRQFVQLDGSDYLTPAIPLVEINDEERVVVAIQNHTATITGNASNPSIGVKTADGLRSEISQTASEIKLLVEDTTNNLSSSITVNADNISLLSTKIGDAESSINQNADSITSIVKNQDSFTEFKQTVEGFSFMGGDVKISGGDLILDGCIKFSDLAEDTKTAIENATPRYQYSVNGLTNWHSTMTSSDKYRRESYDGGSTWGDAYQFRGTDGADGADGADGRDGSDASVTYANIKRALNRASNAAMSILTGTSIDTVDIYANNIYGGNFYAGGEDTTFVNIQSNGLYLYHDDTTNPKIELGTKYDDASVIQLVLGAGASNASTLKNRFFISKHSGGTMLYYADNYSVLSGFYLLEDGMINVFGTLNLNSATSVDWGSHAPDAKFG